MIHTRNEVYEKVKSLYKEFGYLTIPLIESNSDVSRRHIRTTFGSLSSLLTELGVVARKPSVPNPMKGKKKKPLWTKESALIVIREIEKEFGYFSKAMTEKPHPAAGRISSPPIARLWGNFKNLYESESIKSIPIKSHVFKDKDVLISTLKDYYKEERILNAKSITAFCSFNQYSLGSFYSQMIDLPTVSRLIGVDYSRRQSSPEKVAIKVISSIIGNDYVREFKDPDISSPISGRCYPVDFFYKELNLCIEVNGLQHYEYVHYFHKTKETFEMRVMRDHLKYNLIRSKYKLLIVKYSDCETTIANNLKLALAMN